MDKRDAILNGIRSASEFHEKFGFRNTLKDGKEAIDVFQAISNIDLPLLCRPLEGLLGLYTSTPNKGILVTTNRRLPIQRFTAAHELGHHVMGHKESYDSEGSITLARQGVNECPYQEIEAEAFAAEFLLPKWLLFAMIKRQGWDKSDLKNPQTVYQLSLRAGVSYEAMVLCLLSNRMIDRATMEIVRKIPPKNSKLELLGRIKPSDPWADAHLLTEKDSGSKLYASQEDTVIIKLYEHLSGGYLWSILENNNDLVLIEDARSKLEEKVVGGGSLRKIVFNGKNLVNLILEEKRQWDKDLKPINNFEVTVDFLGKEIGLPRVARQ